jgi:Flp pilus assembly protein TadG
MRDRLLNRCDKERGQGMVEFALVLPLLLVVMFGLIEAGRLLFIYSVVFTSTREAARYGSAAGYLSGNIYQYQDCSGIRSAAKRVGSIAGIQDANVTITYDRVTPSGVSPLGSCPVGSTGPRLTLGNRVTVRTTVNYQPLVPVPNLPSFPIVSVSSRTILKDISIEGEQSGGPSTLPTVSFYLDESVEPIDQEEDIPAEWHVKVRLSNTTDEPVTVNFSLAGSADQGGDYSIDHTSQVTIPTGALEETIHIRAVPDTTYEDNETISLTMESTINATRGSPYIIELAIVDDDGPPMVSFAAPTQDVGENYPEIRIAVQLNHPSELNTQVTFSLSGSAEPYLDYNPPALTLTIPAGATSANIVIPLIDDLLFDPNETVVATLESAVNATLGAITVHTATIIDNDVEPTVSFVLDSQSATEATGMVLITAVLRRGLQEVVAGVTVNVPFSVGGTAVSPDDYNISPSPLTIPVGSSRADIVVSLRNDGVAEPDETVIVTLGTPDTADLGSPSTHTLTITSTPTVYFTLASQSVHEAPSRALNIGVRLLPAQTVPVSVPFILSGTALQGQDYTMGTSSPLVIPAGSTSANITVNLIADSVYERDESVVVELGNPTNAVLGEPNVHTLTILNDTPLPVVSFAQPGQNVEENVGNASVQVQLDIASSLPITVPLTLGGSATPGSDYVFNQTQVIIPPGSLGLPLSVQIIDDTLRELDETILLSMGPPTNAVLGTPGAHTITILRSDWPTCTIYDENPLVFDADGLGLSWTLNNTGTDQLVLSSLTISWPTGAPNAPKFDQVFFDSNMIFDGNEPHSPYTVTSWLGFESYRILSTSASVVDTRFTRSLDSGSYVLTLVFRNVTRGYDCSPVTQSKNHP